MQNFEPSGVLGNAVRDDAPAPIPNAIWYEATARKDGLEYIFPAGTLANAAYLTADFLVDGNVQATFLLTLHEGADGPAFSLGYSALNQCQARIRLPLDLTRQNLWRVEREAAWLKPICGGDVVDLAKVDRMRIIIDRKGPDPVRWCTTPFSATTDEPPRLTNPILPAGKLFDELGQSTIRDWPTKSSSTEEVTERLQSQLADAPNQRWPGDFSRWGGWKDLNFEPTGFFRVQHDGSRWWLVDPDGHVFWSAGPDCVRLGDAGLYSGLESALEWLPDPNGTYKPIYAESNHGKFINYLTANMVRAFGTDDYYKHWVTITLANLRRIGFNTVANWSEWQIARAAGFPYVRHMHPGLPNTPKVFRDFPDVYDPIFEKDAAEYASALSDTRDDPAFIGYFLMNEPMWGFASQLPAEGMLLNTPVCETRKALAGWLQQKYQDAAALSKAWGVDTTFDAVSAGLWSEIPAAAKPDLTAFSSIMAERLFKTLSDACRAVDPNHLNLGARYYTIPPRWAFDGMRCFDVFSVNGYSERIKDELGAYSAELNQPIIVGEWHFGALDVGLPASGIGHVKDQAARGQAYRTYLEDAASKPWCIGVHWFTLYDEPTIGRFDGENWNIGFLDNCNREYEPLVQAARLSHERMYKVANAEEPPYDEAPEYLPLLF